MENEEKPQPPLLCPKRIEQFFPIVDKETGVPKTLTADGKGDAHIATCQFFTCCLQLQGSVVGRKDLRSRKGKLRSLLRQKLPKQLCLNSETVVLQVPLPMCQPCAFRTASYL